MRTIFFGYVNEDRTKAQRDAERLRKALAEVNCKNVRVKCCLDRGHSLDWAERHGGKGFLVQWMRNWVGASDAYVFLSTRNSQRRLREGNTHVITELNAARERARRHGRTPTVPLFDSETAPSRFLNFDTPEGLRNTALAFRDFFNRRGR
jgi:hypothetical protein